MGFITLTNDSQVDSDAYNAAGGVGYAPKAAVQPMQAVQAVQPPADLSSGNWLSNTADYLGGDGLVNGQLFPGDDDVTMTSGVFTDSPSTQSDILLGTADFKGAQAMGYTGSEDLYKTDLANANANTSGFGLNTATLGNITAVGQLGLGYLNYKDSHAMNKQNLKGAKFNLAEAKIESKANAAYRKSYSGA